jgi:dipeptidase
LARNSTQTTGSLIAHLHGDHHTYFATGTSAPCSGMFKPLWFNRNTLPDLGPAPGAQYDSESLWWRHEKLHRSVLFDFPNRLRSFEQERDEMEEAWIQNALRIPVDQCWELTRNTFRQARQKTRDWTERIQSLPVEQSNKWGYSRYWNSQNRKAGILIS